MLGALAGGAALLGGILGGQKADIQYAPGQEAAGGLMEQIGRTPLNYVGPGNISTEALNGAQNLNMNISPALAYANNVLSGQYMNNNPYLSSTFDNAAGHVRNALDSQFAAAGRYGSGAHEAAMADQYNNLANDIYGGAYNNERGFMAQAAGLLPSLYGQQVSNLQGLASLGDTQNQFNDQAANWDVYDPYKRLQMMSSGQGMMPQPMYQNTGAGMLGGALGGLQLASGLKGLMA